MRAVLTLVAAGLILPVVAVPVAADGVVYSFQGQVLMKRVERILSKCENPLATLRLDILTPARAATPVANGVAVLIVEGGACEDSNATFYAKSQGDRWTLTDPALGSVGTVGPDNTGNGTYGVSFGLKNVTSKREPSAYTSIFASKGIHLNTTPDS